MLDTAHLVSGGGPCLWSSADLVAQRWDEAVRESVAEIKRIAEMRAARHRPGPA
jgi:hypothetical protein